MMSFKEAIETYVRAKDGNRPHLIEDAFRPDAELAMELKTDSISFPSSVIGADGIAKVLVSQFAQQYENVYTFCMGAPPEDTPSFECVWLVCMTDKSTAAARVGFGRYRWRYDAMARKIERLHITIEQMNTLPSDMSPPILGWARSLPYPWCGADLSARTAPALASIQSVVDGLQRLAGSETLALNTRRSFTQN
jgi:hypothetical protein